jgi:hypothetical protein
VPGHADAQGHHLARYRLASRLAQYQYHLKPGGVAPASQTPLPVRLYPATVRQPLLRQGSERREKVTECLACRRVQPGDAPDMAWASVRSVGGVVV